MQMSGPAFVRFVFCRRSNRFDFWPSPEKPGVSGLQVVAGELPTSGKRSRTARKPSLPTNEHRQLWVGPNTAILRFSTPDRRMHFPNRPRKKTLCRIFPGGTGSVPSHFLSPSHADGRKKVGRRRGRPSRQTNTANCGLAPNTAIHSVLLSARLPNRPQ